MATYDVYLVATIAKTVTIDADTAEDAANLALEEEGFPTNYAGTDYEPCSDWEIEGVTDNNGTWQQI